MQGQGSSQDLEGRRGRGLHQEEGPRQVLQVAAQGNGHPDARGRPDEVHVEDRLQGEREREDPEEGARDTPEGGAGEDFGGEGPDGDICLGALRRVHPRGREHDPEGHRRRSRGHRSHDQEPLQGPAAQLSGSS